MGLYRCSCSAAARGETRYLRPATRRICSTCHLHIVTSKITTVLFFHNNIIIIIITYIVLLYTRVRRCPILKCTIFAHEPSACCMWRVYDLLPLHVLLQNPVASAVYTKVRVCIWFVVLVYADAAEDSPTTAGRGFRSIGDFHYTYVYITTIHSYLWQSPCVHAPRRRE